MSLEFTRRGLLQAGGVLAAGSLISLRGTPTAAAAPASTVTISGGTNLSAAVSPDGSTVMIDALGALWALPVAGGQARRITPEGMEATQASWAPDGSAVVCQAYFNGNFHLCLVPIDRGSVRTLTEGPYDHREPHFSPDGTRIAFSSDRGGSRYGIHVIEVATGRITAWTTPTGEESYPRWSPDGSKIAVLVDNAAIDAVSAEGNRTRLVASADSILYAPSWHPDGHAVAYVRFDGSLPGRYGSPATEIAFDGKAVTAPDEDVFPFAATWLSATDILYTADGRVRLRNLTSGIHRDIGFTVSAPVRTPEPPRPVALPGSGSYPVRGIVGPALSPSGDRIAFCALGDLWVTDLAGRAKRLTHDRFHVCDPAWSPDGRHLAYCTDRAGNTDIWLCDTHDGTERQLTALSSATVAPAWSPDGSRIAFQDQDGATHVLTVATGEVRKVVDAVPDPGRPTWSPDGSMLAFAALKPVSRRFREGTNQILTVRVDTGAITYHAVLPDRSLSGRRFDGPVWSPDGKSFAFVMGGALWVMPVDSAGVPAGAPRQITAEVADAPSWHGDSRTVLYTSLGTLRLVDIRRGVPRTVPLNLTWSPARVSGITVVKAGALWDGLGDSLRRDVDVVIDGDRIAEITPRREWRGAHVVDATGLTVMPGLTDMHAHVHLKGRFFGARQGRLWLAFGVTSVRSPGDPAYLAAQHREAINSGDQLGPRYFAAGDPIDGNRIYYGFTRPTSTAQDVAREIERATALRHDLLKTYVRLPSTSQDQVVRTASGLPVTSHYAYPAARFGVHGMEHLGATSKLGYSQTLSRLGRSYEDLVTLIGKAGMSITPTMFVAAVLLADDDSWLTDERITTLYPAWELAALRNTVALVRRSPATTAALRKVLAANVDTVRRIAAAGGLVVSGTDAPIDHVAVSLHLNLRALVVNGMSAADALRTATGNAAKALGAQDQFGTVTPGKLADLSFVDGDPLADITRAAAVRKVMVGAVLHEVTELVDFPTEKRAVAFRQPEQDTTSEFWWHGHHDSPHACC